MNIDINNPLGKLPEPEDTILDKLPNPDDVGETTYRSVYEALAATLVYTEGTEREIVEEFCHDLRQIATLILDTLHGPDSTTEQEHS